MSPAWWFESLHNSSQINQELHELTQMPMCPHSHIQVQEETSTQLLKLMDEQGCLGFALIADNRLFPCDTIFSPPLTQWDLDLFEEGCTIIWLSSFVPGLRVGETLVNAIKIQYKSILLYSVSESTGFWEKQQFQPFGATHYYGFNEDGWYD